jgi:hypothetical protein
MDTDQRRGKMILGRNLHESMRRSGRHYANECITWSVVAVALYALGGVSGAAAKGGAPLEPYGTNAEIQQCVVDIEASLHGHSILPRLWPVHAIPRRTFRTEVFWRIIWASGSMTSW